MNREDIRNGDNDPKLKFIPDGNNNEKSGKLDSREEFTGLTKEELMEYANDPFWVRLRWFLFALFWLAWIAMLAVAIILIVKAPRCNTNKSVEAWTKDSPIYQIYPRSFKDTNNDGIGDFNGVSSKLDYLSQLGVKNIVLESPLNTNPLLQDEALVNFTKVNPEYGSNNDMKSLITNLHKKGMKAILELDIHHTSNFHPWFNKSTNKLTRQKDFYIWRDGPQGPPSNDRSLWAGSAWNYSPSRNQYYFSHFSANLPNLNLGDSIVQNEIKDIIEFWMKYDIDGILIPNADLLFHLPNETEKKKKTYELINFIKNVVDKAGKNKILIVQPYNLDNNILLGSKADLIVNPSLLKVRDNCDAKCINLLIKDTVSNKKDINQQAWMVGNKDTSRVTTRMGDSSYTNAINSLLLLLPGTAMPYYGDEIAMVDNPQSLVPQTYDPLCKIPFKGECRDLYRSPMQWNALINGGFSNDPNKIWTPVNQNYLVNNIETLERSDKYLPIYKKLVELKSKFGVGEMTLLPLQNPSVLAFLRKTKADTYLVLINFGKEMSVVVPKTLIGTQTATSETKGHIMLDSSNPITFNGSGSKDAKTMPAQELSQSITMKPGQVIVMDLKK